MKPRKSQNREKGQFGEDTAANFLEEEKGFDILARNFRSKIGEIDIVARDKNTLVFVEVKAKDGVSQGTPEEMVNTKKQKQLVRAALSYILEEELGDIDWRIDVVAIEFSPDNEVKRINYIKNAVMGEN